MKGIIKVIDDEIRWVQKCERAHIKIDYYVFEASLSRIRDKALKEDS